MPGTAHGVLPGSAACRAAGTCAPTNILPLRLHACRRQACLPCLRPILLGPDRDLLGLPSTPGSVCWCVCTAAASATVDYGGSAPMGSDLAAPGVALVCQNGPWTHRHQDARHDVLVRETHADLAVLTETQITYDPADILRQPGAGAIWPGAPNFHCPGSGHTGGVAVVLRLSSHLVAPSVFAALNGGGRVLRLDLDVCDVALSLVAGYGPATETRCRPTCLLMAGRCSWSETSTACCPALTVCTPHGSPALATNVRLPGGDQLQAIM